MGTPRTIFLHRPNTDTPRFRYSPRSCRCNIETFRLEREKGYRMACFQGGLEWSPGKSFLQYRANIVTSLTNEPKARSPFTISSHLHILPFSIDRANTSSQHVRTKLHHTYSIRSISQPPLTPSSSPPGAPRLRRIRPSRSSLRSSNNASCIFSFTSHSQYRRPRRRSQSYKDRHVTPHHRRG